MGQGQGHVPLPAGSVCFAPGHLLVSAQDVTAATVVGPASRTRLIVHHLRSQRCGRTRSQGQSLTAASRDPSGVICVYCDLDGVPLLTCLVGVQRLQETPLQWSSWLLSCFRRSSPMRSGLHGGGGLSAASRGSFQRHRLTSRLASRFNRQQRKEQKTPVHWHALLWGQA